MKFYYSLEYFLLYGVLIVRKIIKHVRRKKNYSGEWISKRNKSPDFMSDNIVD